MTMTPLRLGPIATPADSPTGLAATPYLLLDMGAAVARFTTIAAAFGTDAVHYATKANPHPALIAALVRAGSRFDVASPAEVDLCLNAGADPAHLVYSNPIKRRADIRYAGGPRRVDLRRGHGRGGRQAGRRRAGRGGVGPTGHHRRRVGLAAVGKVRLCGG